MTTDSHCLPPQEISTQINMVKHGSQTEQKDDPVNTMTFFTSH